MSSDDDERIGAHNGGRPDEAPPMHDIVLPPLVLPRPQRGGDGGVLRQRVQVGQNSQRQKQRDTFEEPIQKLDYVRVSVFIMVFVAVVGILMFGIQHAINFHERARARQVMAGETPEIVNDMVLSIELKRAPSASGGAQQLITKDGKLLIPIQMVLPAIEKQILAEQGGGKEQQGKGSSWHDGIFV